MWKSDIDTIRFKWSSAVDVATAVVFKVGAIVQDGNDSDDDLISRLLDLVAGAPRRRKQTAGKKGLATWCKTLNASCEAEIKNWIPLLKAFPYMSL